ncbi:MAG: enolase C-terminal domain-like protein [Chlamydiales bacterium]
MDALIYPYKLGKRAGALIELIDAGGKRGVGEIAPLPGWSLETLDEALAALKNGEMTYPSLKFALETAYLGLNLPQLPISLPYCPLLMGSREKILRDARHVVGGVVKVKISDFSDEEAEGLLQELKETFSLRVDLNRKWSLARALKFFSKFVPEDFDFIEEPCAKVEDLKHFPFPIGADESLRDTPLEELSKIPHLKALVLKPTLQGGLRVAHKLASFAQEKNLDLVFSAAFESGVGIAQIALLAYKLNGPVKSLGLDTYRYLEDDVLKKPLDFSEGCLHLREPLFQLKEELSAVPFTIPQSVFQQLAHLDQTPFI